MTVDSHGRGCDPPLSSGTRRRLRFSRLVETPVGVLLFWAGSGPGRDLEAQSADTPLLSDRPFFVPMPAGRRRLAEIRGQADSRSRSRS